MHQETRTNIQSKLKREVSPRWKQSPRYENRFNGYCYSRNDFGHRAMDCTFQGRKHTGNRSDEMICWAYDRIGHVAANCHTLRCFTCGGVSHKSQVCTSSRRQFMRSFSYPSARKVNESWKKNDISIFEYQRINDHNEVHPKVWVRKNIMLDLNEVDDKCTSEGGFHMASHI